MCWDKVALENRGGGYLSFISNYKKKKRQAVFSSRTLFHAECEYILNKEGFFFHFLLQPESTYINWAYREARNDFLNGEETGII